MIMIEAEIIHTMPDDLSAAIGRIVVAHSKVEHKLQSLVAILLQLQRAEARLVLRSPRAQERLDMALDLMAIKGVLPTWDTQPLKTQLETASRERDEVAHGLFLLHEGQIYLLRTRGTWPKTLTDGATVNRSIYPQSTPYGVTDAQKTLVSIESALEQIDKLGLHLDEELQSSPDKFRPLAPIEDRLGLRKKGNLGRPKSSHPSRKPQPPHQPARGKD